MPAVALAFALSMLTQEPAPKADKPAAPVTLNLRCSNAVLEAAAALAEEYRKQQPGMTIVISGGGSGVAMSALADGNADLAITTRPIQREERARALDHGIEPGEQVIATDQLAIVVHKDNPVASLTVAQLTAIWSAEGATTQWSELGVQRADREQDRIRVIGQRADSGSGEFFRTVVLGKHDLRAGAVAAESSTDAIASVAKDPGAIAFCSGAAATGDRVRIVPIAAKATDKPALPGAADGGYPLARPIYLYVHDQPPGTAKVFAAWIAGKQGQAVLLRAGLAPRAAAR